MAPRRPSALRALLASDEPSVRWKARVGVLGEDPDSVAIRRLRAQVRRSERVRRLIEGHHQAPPPAYAKWGGAHWVLAALADLGCPAGERDLRPLADEVLSAWLEPRYFRECGSARGRSRAVPVLDGRARRCASQQGSALLSVVRLGLDDGRAAHLVERLLHWQWPDGGWNCDLRPGAATSSVHETLLPMRGLAAYAEAADDDAARTAAAAASEVFLTRRVAWRRHSGHPLSADAMKLHHPAYWHYDVLAGLVGLSDLGLLNDPRCADAIDLLAGLRGLGETRLLDDPRCVPALDLLQALELPGGGWPAHHRYYTTGRATSGHDYVDWGGASATRMNPWVTADALTVLRAAGRG